MDPSAVEGLTDVEQPPGPAGWRGPSNLATSSSAT